MMTGKKNRKSHWRIWDTSSDEDSYIMKETKLSDLLEDEKQKLLYVFDPLSERVFFIELSEIITGKDLDNAICSRKAGEAPQADS